MKNSTTLTPLMGTVSALLGTVSALAIFASFATGAAIAQEADDDQSVIEEILVTALRREQSLQDVPITITALTESYLAERGIDDLRSYSEFVPGMTYSGTAFAGERSGPDITIRGVANSRLFDFETSIATATTGFVYGQLPAYSFDPRLVDVNRVEVLKGPQGTLYGTASMGGTVKVVPNAPDASEATGMATASLSLTKDGGTNHNIGGAINVPIIEDVLAVRMSAYTLVDSGFIDARLVTGDPNERRGRNGLVSEIDTNSLAIFNIDGTESNFKENINEDKVSGGRVAARYTPNDKLDVTASFFIQTKDQGSVPNFEPLLSSEINKRVTELFILQPSATDYYIAQLEGSYDFGFAKLHSVTGFLNRRFTNATDFSAIVHGALGGDGTVKVPGTAPVNFTSDTDVWSQEVRLEGSFEELGVFDGSFNWVLGYFHQEEDRKAFGSVTVSPNYTANAMPPAAGPPSGSDLVWAGDFRSNYTNDAFFGDVSLEIANLVTLGAGVRHSNQDLSSRRIDFGNVFAGASTPTGTTLDERTINEDPWTPRFSISVAPSKNMTFFANGSKGFRIGGGNPTGNLSTPGCQAALKSLGITNDGDFKSDKIWNYEVGAKTTLADGRVRLNLTGYKIDWDDLQVSVSLSAFSPTCGASIVANVGKATIKGLEAEFTGLITEHLQIALASQVTDAELSKASAGTPAASSGDPIKNIPKFSISAGLKYDFLVLGGYEGFFRADYIHVGKRSFNDIAGGVSDLFNLPSYDLANFRVGFEYTGWEITAFLDNAFDKAAQLGVIVLPGGPGIFSGPLGNLQRFVSTNQPRTVGVQIKRSF